MVIKRAAKKTLSLLGYKLVRTCAPIKEEERILLADPREAFVERNQGIDCGFHAHLPLAIDHQGFSFSQNGWHPFVSALQGSLDNLENLESRLRHYYESFQPKNAAEAIIGFKFAPKIFHELPPHMFYLTPWSSGNVESIDKSVLGWVQKENLENNVDLSLADGGFPTYGPVSEEKLNIEVRRLISITKSLKANGYDRKMGNCKFRVIRAGGEEIRLVIDGGGYHRLSAAAALSFDTVPGNFFPRITIIDINDVEFWPNVRSGLWSRHEAVKYVEHLFSERSSEWARENGLLFD